MLTLICLNVGLMHPNQIFRIALDTTALSLIMLITVQHNTHIQIFMIVAAIVNPWQPHRQCHTNLALAAFTTYFGTRYPLNIRHIHRCERLRWKKFVCPRCLLRRQWQFNQTLAQSCACTDRAASTTTLVCTHGEIHTVIELGLSSEIYSRTFGIYSDYKVINFHHDV